MKTSQMMLGYYNDPQLTAQVLDQDGWYYTGDIGFMGEDGYLRLVDRKKDLIIRGGQNVFPAEVEALLNAQYDLKENGRFPVVILIAGVEGAGKGVGVQERRSLAFLAGRRGCWRPMPPKPG